MGSVIKSITKAVGGMLGFSSGGVSLPAIPQSAPEIPQGTREETAAVRLGADTLEDQLRRSSSSRKSFSSLGGSASGISI